MICFMSSWVLNFNSIDQLVQVLFIIFLFLSLFLVYLFLCCSPTLFSILYSNIYTIPLSTLMSSFPSPFNRSPLVLVWYSWL